MVCGLYKYQTETATHWVGITGNEYPIEEYVNHGYFGIKGKKDFPADEYPYTIKYKTERTFKCCELCSCPGKEIEYWKSKIGQPVIYKKEMPMLTFEYRNETIIPIKNTPQGILRSVHEGKDGKEPWAIIVYPENIGHELINDKWESKRVPLRVYCHSAKLTDIVLVDMP